MAHDQHLPTQDGQTDQRWLAKKEHYQRDDIVAGYDARRFESLKHRRVTARKWAMIREAMGEHFDDVESVLDLPCGTGRFTRHFLDAGKMLVNADISEPMLTAARHVASGGEDEKVPNHFVGGVRCEAESLPLADASIDLVVSIRFLFHVPRELRPAIMREFARVSRRWVVLDVRHRYCLTTQIKNLRALFSGRPAPRARYTVAQLKEDAAAAGLNIRRMVWNYPPFSEKLVILCEKVAS